MKGKYMDGCGGGIITGGGRGVIIKFSGKP